MVLEGVFNEGQDRGVVLLGLFCKGRSKLPQRGGEAQSEIGSEYTVVK